MPAAPPPQAGPAGPGPSPLSRRRFLRIGGVSAAVLGGLSFAIMRGGGDAHYRALLPGAEPVVLSPKELGTLAVFCDRVLPEPSELQPGPRAVRVAERIDRELSFHHAKLRADLGLALLVLEHGGLLHASTTRFTRLAAEEQEAYLRRMGTEGSDVERQVFSNLKFLAAFFYYADERTWAAIHYAGPMQPRKAPPADSSLVELRRG